MTTPVDAGPKTIPRQEFYAGIYPWHATPRSITPTGNLNDIDEMSFESALSRLPRPTLRDIRRGVFDSVSRLIIVEAAAVIGSVLLLMRLPVLSGFILPSPDRPDWLSMLMLLLPLAYVAGLVYWLGRQTYRWVESSLCERWGRPYCETYLQLAETGLAALICDPDFWRELLDPGDSPAAALIARTPPPQTPLAAVNLAADLWPQLLAYQAGERKPFTAWARLGLHKSQFAGVFNWRDNVTVQARAAAIADFLTDLPDPLPPPRDTALASPPAPRRWTPPPG